jgi:hypothetical protein
LERLVTTAKGKGKGCWLVGWWWEKTLPTMSSNLDNKGTSAASLGEGDIHCINKVMLSRGLQWCLGY